MLGGWVHGTSLCSIFAISCRSVIISNWKLKCKNYWGILCLDISWTWILVSQPSCRVEGPSLHGKDGCWAPESQHLKQNYFSRARWKGGMLWVSGNGAPLGTLNLQLKKKKTKQFHQPLRQPRPALSKIPVWRKMSFSLCPSHFLTRLPATSSSFQPSCKKPLEHKYSRGGERTLNFGQAW